MSAFSIVAVIAVVAVITALFLTVDPAQVIAAFENVSPVPVFAGLAIVQSQIVFSALRWRFTAYRLDHHIPLPIAIREYYIATFLNQILPSGMAGDAFRAYRSKSRGEAGWKRPAAAVFLERLSGQLAFFVLVGVGLLAWPLFLAEKLPDGFERIAAVFLAVVLLLVLLALFLQRIRLPARLTAIWPDLVAVFWKDGALIIQFGLSALTVSGYVAVFMIAAYAVGSPLPAIAVVTVIPLCLLTMVIPLGVGGWGTREAAAAALWPLLGFSSAEGLSASLLYGIISLIGVAPFGLFFLLSTIFNQRRLP